MDKMINSSNIPKGRLEDIALKFVKNNIKTQGKPSIGDELFDETVVDSIIVLNKDEKFSNEKCINLNKLTTSNFSKSKTIIKCETISNLPNLIENNQEDESYKSIKIKKLKSYSSERKIDSPFSSPNIKQLTKIKLFKDITFSEINKVLEKFYIPIIKNFKRILEIQKRIKESVNLFNFYYGFYLKNYVFKSKYHNNDKNVSGEISASEKNFVLKIQILELVVVYFSFLLLEIISDSNQSDLKKYFSDGLTEYLHKEIYNTLNLMHDIIMLILLYKFKNEKNNCSFITKSKNNNPFKSLLGKEANEDSSIELALFYINGYFKNKEQLKFKNEAIINKINNNIKDLITLINNCFSKIIDSKIIIKMLFKIRNKEDKEDTSFLGDIGSFCECFKNLNNYFTIFSNNEDLNYKNNILNDINNNTILSYSNLYNNLEDICYDYYKVHKIIIESTLITVPFLPPINKKKYNYTLVLDLDETLVHYEEKNNQNFVQVRPYAFYFINKLGLYFELVVFTASDKEYADIVLKKLDKDHLISHKLYREHTEGYKGSFIKDISKLGRDINKVCIIDNKKENFQNQPENGLHINSFYGGKDDKELLYLCSDLLTIINRKENNIKPILKEIDSKMKKRYKEQGITLD